jgi:hypothetical protein
MSRVMPPLKPPGLGYTDSDGLRRIRFRLWQIFMSAMTLAIAGWFCTMGVFPAIITLLVAKHVLVAILVVGLDLPTGPSGA